MRFGCFFFQAEDGIRDLVRSRGLGDVYKRQLLVLSNIPFAMIGGVFGLLLAGEYLSVPASVGFILSLIHI